LRHTTAKKNKVDGVRSTPYVPFPDVIAFIAVMNETIKPYLAAKGNSAEEVDKMHRAWCKSIQLQLALWAVPYACTGQEPKDKGADRCQHLLTRTHSQAAATF
jgi:hypothetical protein